VHYHAPARPTLLVQAIDFERDCILPRGGVQLGADRRAKHDFPVVKPVMNREDLRFSGINESDPTHVVIPQKAKAFGVTEDFHSGMICRPISHGQLLAG
jgi:hypothetical protein